MKSPIQMITPILGITLLITAGCTSYPRHIADNDHSSAVTESSAPQTLGTQWGEDIQSSVQSVRAIRLSQTPYDSLTIHYRGELVPSHVYTQTAIPLSPLIIQVINEEKGQPMPLYRDKQGRYILPALDGMRYSLRIANNDRKRTYEAVTTVDGLDVLNGQAGSFRNSGYLIRPGKQVEIDGFRKSSQEVAAFRFTTPENAYVNQNRQGDERNIGVIGMAIFEVKEALPDCDANPFPADTKYAPAPCTKR
ncbi:hypothetical protein [Providencia sneebia]|uniref:Lipoprotein n=1 Tax=Providencia sneebia DSM 19967 TaxID=1141660 RepID=K8WMM0_9GAMM|nr:hypothetical protein [Providencia sneebia]EKT61236.1 hypothetical protein OO7_00986 [Providencia sneebia DSM 19967]